MIKPVSERQQCPIEIDTTGPEGNIFAILGIIYPLCRVLEVDFEEIKTFAFSHKCEETVQHLDELFGEFVTFYM